MPTQTINIQGAAGNPLTVPAIGDYCLVQTALGKITVQTESGDTDTLNPGDMKFYIKVNEDGTVKKGFTRLIFTSTVANDVITFQYGMGFVIPSSFFPGGSGGNAAQVAVTQDEFIPIQNVNNAGGTLTFTPKFAIPTFWVHLNGGGTLASGSVKITATTFDTATVPCICYDQFGNQVSDSSGVIQFGQINFLVAQNSSLASLFIDGTGLSSITVTNNLNVATNVGIGGTHLPASLMIGQEKTQPGYHAAIPFNTTGTVTGPIADLTPPVGGAPVGGYLVLERVLLAIAATASSPGRTIKLIRNSTLNLTGTSVSQVGVGRDPQRPTLGIAKSYSVVPGTIGTQNDIVDSQWITIPTSGAISGPNVIFDFRTCKEKPKIPFTAGSTWQFAITLDAGQGGQAVGVTWEFRIE